MGISPIEPSHFGDFPSSQKKEWNQINYGMNCFLLYFVLALDSGDFPPGKQSAVMAPLEELKEEIAQGKITPQQAVTQFNQIINDFNQYVKSNAAYPNDFALGNVYQQVEAFKAFLQLDLSPSKSAPFMSGVNHILNELSSGSVTNQEAMEQLAVLAKEVGGCPIPDPNDYS